LSAKPENLELIGPADDRGYSKFNRSAIRFQPEFGLSKILDDSCHGATAPSTLIPGWYASTSSFGSNTLSDAVLTGVDLLSVYAAGSLRKTTLTDPDGKKVITPLG